MQRVTSFIAFCGAKGAIADEIKVALECENQTVTPAIRRLLDKEHIHVDGLRENRRGHECRVYKHGSDPEGRGPPPTPANRGKRYEKVLRRVAASITQGRLEGEALPSLVDALRAEGFVVNWDGDGEPVF